MLGSAWKWNFSRAKAPHSISF